jgi:hypothetical protein
MTGVVQRGCVPWRPAGACVCPPAAPKPPPQVSAPLLRLPPALHRPTKAPHLQEGHSLEVNIGAARHVDALQVGHAGACGLNHNRRLGGAPLVGYPEGLAAAAGCSLGPIVCCMRPRKQMAGRTDARRCIGLMTYTGRIRQMAGGWWPAVASCALWGPHELGQVKTCPATLHPARASLLHLGPPLKAGPTLDTRMCTPCVSFVLAGMSCIARPRVL